LSSQTPEKRALIKEEGEAQKLLQETHNNNIENVLCLHMAIGKVLLNLELKLSRLESANEKVVDVHEQNNDTEGAEQFQKALDEEADLIDDVLTRTSELKVTREKT